MRGLLAHCPPRGQPGRPVGVLRQKFPRVQIIAGQGRPVRAGTIGGKSRDCFRGSKGCAWRLGASQERFPERCKNRIGVAGAGGDRPRFNEQVGLKTLRLEPRRLGVVLDGGIQRTLGATVTPVPVDGRGAGLANQVANHIVGPALTQHQGCAQPREARAQPFQTVVQPPVGGTAEGANTRRDFVANVNHDNGMSSFCRSDQRGVIRSAQVVAQPDDAWPGGR